MKCTYHWLKEFVDFDFSPSELAHELTMLGLEVDSVTEARRNIQDAIVGQITEKTEQGKAIVDVGGKKVVVQIKSDNLTPGQKVVIDLASEPPQIATYAALQISADKAIIFVETATEVGAKVSDLIPETDTIYDIDLTPNRPDCLSIVGIAREIATITGNSLRPPSFQLAETAEPAANHAKVAIQTPEGCPRYAARIIKNLNIQPSPLWLVDRLEKVGLRAINNVVDVTNYVMIELGHPLHAFDYELILGREIQVRLSKDGEHFITLDGKGHTLNESTVLICDSKRAVALGGIMGGQNSEINESTKDLLLECAYFTPTFIRRSTSMLGITTDASVRFNRGADPNGVERAINRTAYLLNRICDGEVLKGIIDEYPAPIANEKIYLRTQRVQDVLGTAVKPDQIKKILSNLGCELQPKSTNGKADNFDVSVPTFRPDLTREIDLIEEAARIMGFDKIPQKYETSLKLSTRVNKKERHIRQIKDFWIGNGFNEVISNSMIPSSDICLQFFQGQTIRLQNPLSEDMAVLRPSLIPSMIDIAQYNLFRQQQDIRLFEIGNTFLAKGKNHQEFLNLGGVLIGNTQSVNWETESRPVNFFDLKGLISAFFRALGISGFQFSNQMPHWGIDEEVGLQITRGDDVVGVFGLIKKEILDKYDISTECYIFELNLKNIFSYIKSERLFEPVPRHPSVQRDLAFVVNYDIPGGTILDEIKKWGGTYLKDLTIFDVYTGEQVPVSKKSVAVSLIFQAQERTLTEDEINNAVDLIITKLSNSLQAELRS